MKKWYNTSLAHTSLPEIIKYKIIIEWNIGQIIVIIFLRHWILFKKKTFLRVSKKILRSYPIDSSTSISAYKKISVQMILFIVLSKINDHFWVAHEILCQFHSVDVHFIGRIFFRVNFTTTQNDKLRFDVNFNEIHIIQRTSYL